MEHHLGHCRGSEGARLRGAALPFPGRSVRDLEEGLGVTAVGGVAGLQGLRGGGFAVGVGGRRVGALAGAAARLRAGAGLLHLPPLGQGGLVHVLKAKPLSLVLVEGLRERNKGTPIRHRMEDSLAIMTYSGRRLWLSTNSSKVFGNRVLKPRYPNLLRGPEFTG